MQSRKIFNSALILLLAFTFTAIGVCSDENNIEFFSSSQDKYQKVLVSDIRRVDLIVLESGEIIKLIGLIAPPTPKKEKIERNEYGFVIKKDQPWSPIEDQAFEYAKSLLLGQYVRLEFDVLKKNDRHETLAYAFLTDSNLMANSEILKQGFAHLRISPPNIKYAEQLRSAYKEARKEKRGLQSDY